MVISHHLIKLTPTQLNAEALQREMACVDPGVNVLFI